MFSSNQHAQHIIFPLKPIHSNREKGRWGGVGGGFGGVERLFDCFAEVFNAQQIFKTALMGLETMHFHFQHSPLIKQNKINQVCGKNPRLREMLPSFLAWLVREEGRKKKTTFTLLSLSIALPREGCVNIHFIPPRIL